MSDPDRILEHCPFPDVGRSLQPYVKTRQEVAAIRNSLQAKLPNSAINSSLPTSKDIREITSVTGVRKAYLRALQAHQAAQARYDSLKAELEELSHASSSTSDPAADNGSFMTESYIPLMRQREKHRKLKILQATLAKVDAAGGKTIADSFDKVTRRQVGDLPVPPPAAAFAERDAGTESEYDLTRLKKAILAVRHQLEEHEAATVQANGVLHGDLNPHADLYALKKAHNELTAWMEQQLAMISDLEAPKDGDGEAQEHDMSNGEAEYGLKDIESLYEQYLHSREHLLELVTNSSSAIPSAPSSPEVIRRPSTTPEPEQSQSASEALLPYLSRLVLMRQAERDLLQQSSYVRRQLHAAETRTHEVLERLASESHLVQPELRRGTSYGTVWKTASAEAGKSTAEAATQRLKAGQASADSASKSLEAIQSVPKDWDALVE